MASPFPTARDPLLSLLQSAAAAVARRRAPGADPLAHPLPAAVAALVAAGRGGGVATPDAGVRATPGTAPGAVPGATPSGSVSTTPGAPLGTASGASPGMARAAAAVPGLAAATATSASSPSAATTCAGLGLALLRATVAGDAAQARAWHDRLAFSQCDPLWAETLLDYARALGPDGRPRPMPYRRHAALGDFVLTAPSARFRLGLLSDWGTGTAEARGVAALLARQRPDAVAHLGDIYFAGTPEECTTHFLAPLRALLPQVPLFTLCGNHDAYSGGIGYYGLLDRIAQPASYFCLRSPDHSWQVLAADTGRHDRDPLDVTTAVTFLEPSEEEWHADKLRGFGGRSVLLSHHQPFSAFAQIGPFARHDPTNPRLMESHARLSQAGRLDAWFWGHEHRLHLYAPYRGVRAGRNIGYGAIPVQAGADATLPGLVDPPALAAAVPLDVVDGAWAHGFALLDLAPERVEASYWSVTRPDGPVHREVLG